MFTSSDSEMDNVCEFVDVPLMSIRVFMTKTTSRVNGGVSASDDVCRIRGVCAMGRWEMGRWEMGDGR